MKGSLAEFWNFPMFDRIEQSGAIRKRMVNEQDWRLDAI